MAGLIAAEGNNHVGITGVMRASAVMALKALDARGRGTIADVVEAMDYAVAQRVAVITCSFTTSGKSQALLEAIKRAATVGILVVAAAGNNKQDLKQRGAFPASYQIGNLIAVAATSECDLLAEFSNWGAGVHTAAPGVGLLTTGRGGSYVRVTGTSAAAALVAGVAGLLKTLRGWISPQTIRQSLIAGARPVPELADKVASGGVVNAGGAIEALIRRERRSGSGSGATSSAVQGQASLDYLRAHTPAPPDPYVPSGVLPGATYDDPQPGSTVDFSNYYTELTKDNNAAGVAGSQPMQMVDPTASAATVGGVSINLYSGNYNFTAPVVSLKGRAGLDLTLSLAYNSRVWTRWGGTMFFNAEKGFPGPGWRIGFGAIQGSNNGGAIGPYSNSVTGKQSFIYLAPDGTRRDLAYNPVTGLYESYDSSYLDFNPVSRVLRTPAGMQITFWAQATANGDYQYLPTLIKDRNGNLINLFYRTLPNNDVVIDYLIDTLGRRIDFYYQSNRLL